MKKSIHNLLIGTVALGLWAGPVRAADKDPYKHQENRNARSERVDENQSKRELKAEKNELDDQTERLNNQARKGDRMEAALKTINVETGVPLDRVREMHKKHGEAGAAGIMNACVLADNTKKDPEDLLKEHVKGKSWAQIARENNVPIEKLNERLAHMERALGT